MKVIEINKHKNICVMGLGKMYDDCIKLLEQNFRISYICDNNPLYRNTMNSSKFSFVSPEDLPKIDDIYVIVTTSFNEYMAIDNQLSVLGIPNCYVRSIQGISFSRPVIQLCKLTGPYEDQWGNVIEIARNVRLPRNSFVVLGDDTRQSIHHGRGRNNRLLIGENTNLAHSLLLEFWGDDCSMDIGENSYFEKIHVVAAQGSCLKIGARSSAQDLHAVIYEGGRVIIGEDCMFSHNIQLWQTDTHPIFNRKTKNRINKGRNITIGDHVWLGANTTLLGGAEIGNGSIIGMNSVTSSKIPANAIAAGNPARIIRENVIWSKDQLYLSDINSMYDCRDLAVKGIDNK